MQCSFWALLYLFDNLYTRVTIQAHYIYFSIQYVFIQLFNIYLQGAFFLQMKSKLRQLGILFLFWSISNMVLPCKCTVRFLTKLLKMSGLARGQTAGQTPWYIPNRINWFESKPSQGFSLCAVLGIKHQTIKFIYFKTIHIIIITFWVLKECSLR